MYILNTTKATCVSYRRANFRGRDSQSPFSTTTKCVNEALRGQGKMWRCRGHTCLDYICVVLRVPVWLCYLFSLDRICTGGESVSTMQVFPITHTRTQTHNHITQIYIYEAHTLAHKHF